MPGNEGEATRWGMPGNEGEATRWGMPGKAEPLPLLYTALGLLGNEGEATRWGLPGKAEPLPLLYTLATSPEHLPDAPIMEFYQIIGGIPKCG